MCSRPPSRAHGYARPVLGTDASVTALSRAALAARFAETHAGHALTVVIVGDVDASALAAAERAFARDPGREQADGVDARQGSSDWMPRPSA